MTTLSLLPCPFCGQTPVVEPWHGGAPTKVMVRCVGLGETLIPAPRPKKVRDCPVAPSVTGETPREAARHWNRRSDHGLAQHLVEVTTDA